MLDPPSAGSGETPSPQPPPSHLESGALAPTQPPSGCGRCAADKHGGHVAAAGGTPGGAGGRPGGLGAPVSAARRRAQILIRQRLLRLLLSLSLRCAPRGLQWAVCADTQTRNASLQSKARARASAHTHVSTHTPTHQHTHTCTRSTHTPTHAHASTRTLAHTPQRAHTRTQTRTAGCGSAARSSSARPPPDVNKPRTHGRGHPASDCSHRVTYVHTQPPAPPGRPLPAPLRRLQPAPPARPIPVAPGPTGSDPVSISYLSPQVPPPAVGDRTLGDGDRPGPGAPPQTGSRGAETLRPRGAARLPCPLHAPHPTLVPLRPDTRRSRRWGGCYSNPRPGSSALRSHRGWLPAGSPERRAVCYGAEWQRGGPAQSCKASFPELLTHRIPFIHKNSVMR